MGCPGHRLPPGVLLGGKEGVKTALEQFENAKKIDAQNEKQPPADAAAAKGGA